MFTFALIVITFGLSTPLELLIEGDLMLFPLRGSIEVTYLGVVHLLTLLLLVLVLEVVVACCIGMYFCCSITAFGTVG